MIGASQMTPCQHEPIEVTRFGARRCEYHCAKCGHAWQGRRIAGPVPRLVLYDKAVT